MTVHKTRIAGCIGLIGNPARDLWSFAPTAGQEDNSGGRTGPDRIKRLAKPHRLYGRELSSSSFLESFRRVTQGEGQVVLVPGYSGVGKTSLVLELRRAVREQNGFFLQGKFNQYQQNIPYYEIREAFAA